MSFVDAAKRYLKQGLHPIPCESRGKRPLVAWKEFQEIAPTWDQVEEWWYDSGDGQMPNLALVLGRGYMALDIDGSDGLSALYAEHVTLADLMAGSPPIVGTGKGLHIYYRGTATDRVKLVERVDVRGVGIVVAPPSIHPLGHPYVWLHNEGAEIPPAPASLMRLIEQSARPAAAASGLGAGWVTRKLQGVSAERNHAMARLVGYFWQKGVDRDVIELLMRDFLAKSSGDHAFTEEEFQNTMNSITARDGGPRLRVCAKCGEAS